MLSLPFEVVADDEQRPNNGVGEQTRVKDKAGEGSAAVPRFQIGYLWKQVWKACGTPD